MKMFTTKQFLQKMKPKKITSLKNFYNLNDKKNKLKIALEDQTLNNAIDSIMYFKPENFIKEVEKCQNKIEKNLYKLDNVPDPNCFGESIVYLGPDQRYVDNYVQDNWGIFYFFFVSNMIYMGLLFNNYLVGLFVHMQIANSFYRKLRSHFRNLVLQINLINENQVRVTYFNGKTEFVDIKDIQFDLEFSPVHLSLHFVKIKIKYRYATLMLIDGSSVCFYDLNLFPAIINKNVHGFTYRE